MRVGREVGFVPTGLLFVIEFVLSEGGVALDCWLCGVDVLGVGVNGPASPPETMVCLGPTFCGTGENVCGPDEFDKFVVDPVRGDEFDKFVVDPVRGIDNVCGPDEFDTFVVDPVRGIDCDADVRLDGGVTTGVGALGRLASTAPGSSWAVWANPAATFWASVAQADGAGRSANWTCREGSVVRLYPVSMIARTAGSSATRIGCGTPA